MLPLVESTIPLLRLRPLSRYVPDKRTSAALGCVPSDYAKEGVTHLTSFLSSLVPSLCPRRM